MSGRVANLNLVDRRLPKWMATTSVQGGFGVT